MNLYHAIFLGFVQGLTEFLPVSSSGHLVLAQKFMPGFTQPGILFDVVLHLGTLLAVLVYFRKRIMSLSRDYMGYLVVGTIPAVFAGIFFSDFFEGLYGNMVLLGLGFIVTGIINFLVDKFPVGTQALTTKSSFIIGVFQALAIVPSVSRSGLTIFAANVRGISKEHAAEFSFLLSVPAILGANVLEIYKYGGGEDVSEVYYFAGFLVAMIVGLGSIKMTLMLLTSRNFKYFGIYCVVVGLVTLLLL